MTYSLAGIFEEVFVDPLDDILFPVLDADIKFGHRLREHVPVDQDESRGGTFGAVLGVRGEAAGGDEDATIRLSAVQGPYGIEP